MLLLVITSVPPGEAPEWVREKWVGLSLPLADEAGALHSLPTVGVISHPKTRLGYYRARLTGRVRRASGYIVYSTAAIEVLERSSPEAAAWWRNHVPWVVYPGRILMFQEGVGHVETVHAS